MNPQEFLSELNLWLLGHGRQDLLIHVPSPDAVPGKPVHCLDTVSFPDCSLVFSGEDYELCLSLNLSKLYAMGSQNGWPHLLRHLEKTLQTTGMHRRPQTVDECALTLDETDRILFLELCKLRAALADAKKISAYIVLPNRTVLELARRKPVTEEDFLLVPGIGEKKLALYGESFLTLIREFIRKYQA